MSETTHKSPSGPKSRTRKTKSIATDAIQATGKDRRGDRLVQLPEMVEITTLTEATLRWLRHRGEGPPMFKLGRRLVVWESDLHAWIEQHAREDASSTAGI